MSLSRKQQAAIVYLAIPKEERTMNLQEFCADVLEIDERQVRRWYKTKEFQDSLKTAKAEYQKRAGDLFEKAARSKALMVMISGMKNSDKEVQRKYASTVLKEIKDTKNVADTVSYEARTDEALIAEMFERGFDLPASELKKFRDLIGLEELT